MDDKEENTEKIQKQVSLLIEFHTKDLERLKKNLKISGLKRITRQLIERAIEDKEELLKSLQK